VAAADKTFLVLNGAADKGGKQSEIEMADFWKAGREVVKYAVGGFDHWQLTAGGCGRRCLIS
jgi:hypothetical protein